MKKVNKLKMSYLLTGILMLSGVQNSFCQSQPYQIVVANGGDFANPNDYVSVGTYNIQSKQYSTIDSIYTQSVQDVFVYNEQNQSIAYVAAQDSVVAYDLLTNERLAAVEKLGVQTIVRTSTGNYDYLLVSKGFGADSAYFELLDPVSLSSVKEFENVDDECSGVTVFEDSAFIAMPGNWMSTVGKIQVIDLVNQAFVRTIDLDTMGAGIYDVFIHNGHLYSLNSLGWGSTIGIVSKYNFTTGNISHDTVQGSLNAYAEVDFANGLVYLSINGKLATYDPVTQSIDDSSLVDIDYSALAVSDDNIFLTNTAYSVNANLYSFDNAGSMQDSIEVGISAEAMAIDYRSTVGVESISELTFQIFPNPTSNDLYVKGMSRNSQLHIYDVSGKQLLVKTVNNPLEHLDVSKLSKGVYIVRCVDGNQFHQQKLVIQ